MLQHAQCVTKFTSAAADTYADIKHDEGWSKCNHETLVIHFILCVSVM